MPNPWKKLSRRVRRPMRRFIRRVRRRLWPPVGSIGETIALRFLLRKGFDVLARNFRIGKGEIDLIAYHGDDLVFVEVKTRSRLDDFAPQLAVTPAKEEQILRLAQAFRHRYGLEEIPVRLDVVAVTLQGTEEPKVEHFQRAV